MVKITPFLIFNGLKLLHSKSVNLHCCQKRVKMCFEKSVNILISNNEYFYLDILIGLNCTSTVV